MERRDPSGTLADSCKAGAPTLNFLCQSKILFLEQSTTTKIRPKMPNTRHPPHEI